MTDALDAAIARAAEPEPQAIRLEVVTGPGKPPAVVILPLPITEVDLFRLGHHLSTWYAEQVRAQAAQGIAIAPANVPLPPPPGGH